MRLPTVLLFVVLTCLNGQAQPQENIDSLNAIWNDVSKDDTLRFLAKFTVAKEQSYSDQIGSQKSFRELLTLGRKIGGKYVPRAMQGLSVTHYGLGNYDSALFYAQKAYHLSESLNYKKGMCNALINMYRPYSVTGKDSLSLVYGLRALELAAETHDSLNLTLAYTHIGDMYNRFGETGKALEAFKKGHQIALKIGDLRRIVIAERMLAFQYYSRNDLKRAIELNMDALKILDQHPNDFEKAGVYNNLALIYKDLREYDRALDFFNKTAGLVQNTNDKSNLAGTWLNMANLHFIRKDFEKSMAYNDKASEIFYELNFSYGLAFTENLSGQIYLEQGQFEEAIKKFQSVFTYIDDNLEAAYAYGNQAKAYYEIKEYKKAVSVAERGIKIAKEKQNYDAIGNAADILHRSYAALKNYPKAYETAVLLNQVADSINKVEDKKALYRQEFQYEYEKQALADSLEQNEEKLKLELVHQEQLAKKNRTRNFYMGAGILFFLLAGGGWSRAQYIKKANARLEYERNRAEESERFKQRFLANMSHEIRTPMNAVLGMTELTLDTRVTKKQRMYLEAIKNASENLLVIINDILDLSKMEQGKLTFETVPFILREQVELVYQTLQFKAEEKGLDFSVGCEDEVADVVIGDPFRLLQILINLAGNAIKFTERGQIRIHVANEGENRIRFSVSDTGIGIHPEKQALLFESFSQADESTSRKYGGTGLGLTISKELVEMQGGNIEVESSMGEGSTFSFSLFLPETSRETLKNAVPIDVEKLRDIQILVAEDNPFNRIVINDTLINILEGVSITLVENGEQAFEALEKGHFDLVLMDVHMPVMDGFDATKKIRNSSLSQKDIPIIALTASVMKEDVQKCLNAGMNAVLPKPFKRDELVRMLADHLPESSSK